MGRSVTVFRVCRVPGMIVQYGFKLCNTFSSFRIVVPCSLISLIYLGLYISFNAVNNVPPVVVEPLSPLANG